MSLSAFPDLNWRDLNLTDRDHLLSVLEASYAVDGAPTHPFPNDTVWAQDAWGGFDKNGQLVGYVWIQWETHRVDMVRAFINGRVHPAYRSKGVGTVLLKWAEDRAKTHYHELTTPRPLVLRIDFTTGGEDVIELCENNGYQFTFAEDYFEYDLTQPLPTVTLPDGITLLAYTDTLKDRFYRAFFDSFQTRPRFPGYDLATWYSAWIQGDDSFLPQLSFLATNGVDDLATILCHVEQESVYISQLGTPPAYRRQGIAGGLITTIMQQACALGFKKLTLSVNLDNPEARHLYEVKLGFTRSYRYYSYQKHV